MTRSDRVAKCSVFLKCLKHSNLLMPPVATEPPPCSYRLACLACLACPVLARITSHDQQSTHTSQRSPVSNLKEGAGGRRPKALKYIYLYIYIYIYSPSR